MKIVTSEQMRRIEGLSESAGVSTDALMENAGLEVAKSVRRHMGRTVGARVLVLVGPGNNGGDGLVAARHLLAWGAHVLTYLVRDRDGADPNMARLGDRSTAVALTSTDAGLARLREGLQSASMVVDAVLGTGRSRPIEGPLKAVLDQVRGARERRPDLGLLAVDLPTGLDSDTGQADPACVRADVTVALGYPKVGLYQLPGADYAGRVEVADIGLPRGLDDDVGLELMTREWAGSALPARPSAGHKGTFGRALVVAGSERYVGAAILAASAAIRAGAGLVTLAIPESLQAAAASGAPEPTYLPLPESSRGVHSEGAADTILRAAASYDSLLVGCGLGQESQTRRMVDRLLFQGDPLPPTVVDADGLNLLALAGDPGWWEKFEARAVVTPHPGEMGRLMGRPTATVQRNRLAAAAEEAAKWNKVVVLKGAYTVVASPGGGTMLSPFSNPGLASAGTGDVLAGIIVGLLAQGMDMERAAALGVYLHGAAGELVRQDLGAAGMLASDLLPALPKAMKELGAGF